MLINYSEIFTELQNAVAEFNTPYPYHTRGPEEEELIERFVDVGANPFEFCDYIYRHWGPDKLIRGVMITDKAWKAFVEFRNIRQSENKIKTDLEKHRMKYLMDKECDIRDVLTSELETFLVLFKYIIAKTLGLDDLVELFKEGARYELRVMPELKKYLGEFREEHFPDE